MSSVGWVQRGQIIIIMTICIVHLFHSSDGACHHVAASLYDVESYHYSIKSVTDGPVQWKKRARPDDEPEPVSTLTIKTIRLVELFIS